jgi:5'-nucleotidase
LEHGISRIAEDKEEGRFPQISGIRFSYDSRRLPGSRLVRVSINGQPLDDEHVYILATNTYLTEGGDGYSMLTGLHYLVSPVEGPVVPALIISAVVAAGKIEPQVDGRIVPVDASSTQ